MSCVQTRNGDGHVVVLTAEQLRDDLWSGSEHAARRARIPALTEAEIDHLFDIFAHPGRITGVHAGQEVVLTKDGCANTLYNGQMSSGVAIPLSREQGIRVMERALGFDTMEVAHPDYSFKPAKQVLSHEQVTMAQAQLDCVVPLLYGAMPNLGLYYRPDGPTMNPADLLPEGRIDEARQAQMEAADLMRRDMLYVGHGMAEVSADGIDFDTTGSAGDAEFLATLQAVAELSASTDMAIEVGMATEMVLGFHGELRFQGTRLAGLWPHQQVAVVEKAGAHIFGPAVTTNTGRSVPWNVSRACTLVKECSRVSTIPVHANVGMGVGGVPTYEVQPNDVVARVGVALVEIGRADGL